MGKSRGVRAVSKSSIQIGFTFKGVRCREILKLKPTNANLKYAQNRRGEIQNKIVQGTFIYSEYFPNSKRAKLLAPQGYTWTIAEALEKYLETAKSELQTSTYLDYRNSVRNKLQPAFGDIPIGKLKRSDIKFWITTLNVSPKRIQNMLLPLRAVLSDALADGIIEINPLYGWTPKVKQTGEAKEKIDPFTPNEIKSIINAADGQLGNMVLFGCWTGLRISELIAIRWEDINGDIAHIVRASVAHEIKGPKTKNGIRDIKLLKPAQVALKAQKPHTYLMREFVFHAPSGEPWRDDGQLRKQWVKTLKKTDVRYRPPSQMRHTYASTMCSAGETLQFVANQMGHSDTSMVSRVYGKWIPEIDPLAGLKAVTIWEEAS